MSLSYCSAAASAQCTKKVDLVHFSYKLVLMAKKRFSIILGDVLKHSNKKKKILKIFFLEPKGGPFESNKFWNNFEHNSLGNIFRSISEHFAVSFIISHTLIKVKIDHFSPHFTPQGSTSLKV